MSRDSEPRFADTLEAHLRVFPASFDLEAAHAVCCPPATSGESFESALGELVKEGKVVPMGHGRWRCTSLPQPTHPLGPRHARHYDAIALVARSHMGGRCEQMWLDRLDVELPNLRQAMEWGLGPDGDREVPLRVAVGTFSLWYKRGRLLEGAGWLRRALAAFPTTNSRLRIEGTNAAGTLAGALGEIAEGRRLLMEALECAWAMQDRAAEAAVLSNLGINFRDEGDLDEARKAFASAATLWRDQHEAARLANSLANLAAVLVSLGRSLEAEPLLTEAECVFECIEDAWSKAMIGCTLADIALARQEAGAARARALASLQTLGCLGDRRGAAQCLSTLARIEALARRPVRAAVLFGATESARAATHTQVPLADLAPLIAAVEGVRDALGDQGYDRAWDEGFALSAEGAAAYASDVHADADADVDAFE